MKIITELSLSMCVMSVVSMIIFCILPENNGFKQVFKLICGLLLVSVVLNSIISFVNTDFGFNQFVNSSFSTDDLEEYMLQKNTNSYLIDISKQTEPIFKKHNTKCSKISFDKNNELLIFYIDKDDGVSIENLTDELNNTTKVNCFVMVGANDE